MRNATPEWEWHEGDGPVIGVALHAGHKLDAALVPHLVIDESDMLREEDPHTDEWARQCDGWVLVNRSRFEVDLNRPRDKAVYNTPSASWGLRVWKDTLPAYLTAGLLKKHDLFYLKLNAFLAGCARRFGAFVVLDLHSYNHRRGGQHAIPADPALNPWLNVGTGSMDRCFWSPVIERFMDDMRITSPGQYLRDVRENVNFKGRFLAEYVHKHFPGQGCVLALEFKKTFMDEWTGATDIAAIEDISQRLSVAIAGIHDVLSSCYGQSRRHGG